VPRNKILNKLNRRVINMDEKKKKMVLNAALQLKYGETIILDNDKIGDNLSYRVSLIAEMLDNTDSNNATIKDECGRIVKIIF